MQVLVVGAGVVGLAVARTAALRGHDVIVAEATGGIGNGVSSRNSEVVHAGIYYPTASLRARHCVRGRRMLYEFCASHGVATNKCGKLIVATDQAELAKVETLLAQGLTNGVEGLEMIGGNAARALEPELACIGALSSPESGIIDSHGYMLALWGELGRSRRQHRVRNAGRALVLCRAALACAIRRPRRRHRGIRRGGEFGRARRAGAGAEDRGLPGRESAAARARQRQLFRLRRTAGLLAADLSDAGRWRARRACHARPCRPHALRPGRRMDRSRELYRRSAPFGFLLSAHSQPTGPACPMDRWCRTIAASGRS